jgi:hypothetical protein
VTNVASFPREQQFAQTERKSDAVPEASVVCYQLDALKRRGAPSSNSFSVNVLPIAKWKRCGIFSHFISQQQTAQGIFLSWSTVGWDEAERIPAYFPFNISSLSRQKRTLPRLQLHDRIVPPVLIGGFWVVERVVQAAALMSQAGTADNQLSHGGQVA